MGKNKTSLLVALFLGLAFLGEGCTTPSLNSATSERSRNPASTSAQFPLTFFSSPEDGHRPFIQAIGRAHQTIIMEMFHLNDTDITDELAKLPASVEVSLILNFSQLKKPGSKDLALMNDLVAKNSHIHFYPSTKSYSLTHTKSMVVDPGTDNQFAIISSMNLVKTEVTPPGPHPVTATRDYGVETHDPDLVGEMETVFKADIGSSVNGGKDTPPLHPADPHGNSLIWSDKTSRQGLLNLIAEAELIPAGPQRYIKTTVESIGDEQLEGALSHAVAQGVSVQMLIPMCIEGFDHNANYEEAGPLATVALKYARKPYSSNQPYIHGKMIILGNGRGYLGSVNFSPNSMDHDRELGIVFTDMSVKNKLEGLFDHDYGLAAAPSEPAVCSGR